MSMGTLALAWLLVAAGASPGDAVPINQRNFQIPIRIDATRRHEIKELILFSSPDQGATWNQVAVASPDKDAFVYYAPADGAYWFSVVVVDLKGNREPPDIYKVPPGQKVLVDTAKPVIRFTSMDRQGDDLVVGWEVQEDYPDLGSLKLDYRPADAMTWSWTPVAVNTAMSGQARFHSTTSGPLTLRMQMQDLAGNQAILQSDVQKSSGSVSAPPTITTSASPAPPAPNAFSPPAPAPTAPALPVAPPPVSASPAGAPGAGAYERAPAIQPASVSPNEMRGSAERPWPPAASAALPSLPGAEPGTRLVATSELSPSPTARPPLTSDPKPARAPAAQAPITNSTQVSLTYEVSKAGPSGLGAVELWLTQDDGRTWRHFADDPDLQPPIVVDLPGEGVYGFYLVLKNKAGIGRRQPQPGDLPQMRLEVDTTAPVAQLYEPQADPLQPGRLMLSWNVTDRTLAPNPITLQWAALANGPWQAIGTELPNTGRYTWQLPNELPARVFLRLLARDAAGNTCIAQTTEPILVDLVEPEGQLTGVAGGARRP